jgi:hypothetical protein
MPERDKYLVSNSQLNRIMDMKITNLQFDASEIEAIKSLAIDRLRTAGKKWAEIEEIVPSLTPQNVLRLALGLEIKKRGGKRPNTGRKIKEKEAEEKKSDS